MLSCVMLGKKYKGWRSFEQSFYGEFGEMDLKGKKYDINCLM